MGKKTSEIDVKLNSLGFGKDTDKSYQYSGRKNLFIYYQPDLETEDWALVDMSNFPKKDIIYRGTLTSIVSYMENNFSKVFSSN